MAEVNDKYAVRIIMTMQAQTSVNVRHYLTTAKGGVGVSDLALAQAVDGLIAANAKGMISSLAVYRGVGAKRILPTVGIERATTLSIGVGTIGGDPLPKQICGVATFISDDPGRHGRGRIYTPFHGETMNDANGLPSLAALNLIDLFVALLTTTITVVSGPDSNSWKPVVFNRLTGLTHLITGRRVRSFWGTQRRRGDFGAANLPPF